MHLSDLSRNGGFCRKAFCNALKRRVFSDGEKRKEEAEMKKKKRVGELFRDIFKYNI